MINLKSNKLKNRVRYSFVVYLLIFSGFCFSGTQDLSDENENIKSKDNVKDSILTTTLDCSNKNKVSVHCGETPTTVIDRDGVFWTVFEYKDKVFLTSSTNGVSFTTPIAVNDSLEPIYTGGENRPKIRLGNKGEFYISWTKKMPGRFTGDIRFTRSVDFGKSFSPVKTINDDNLVTGHRFETLNVSKDGTVFLAWIDKRDRIIESNKNKKTPKMTASIYYTYSTDSGLSFSKNQRLASGTCVCCRIASEPSGKNSLSLLWRNVYDDNIRDHTMAKINSSSIVKKPIRATYDDWKIDACPHHGPALVEDKDATTHITWFTASDTRKGLFYSTITSDKDFNKEPKHISNHPTAGHPSITSIGNKVRLVWKEFDGEKTSVYLLSSENLGSSWSDKQILASTNGESDHPFLIQNGESVWLSWHSLDEGLRIIPVH